MARNCLTISEMRARCKDYFFSKATRRFFRGSRNYARCNRRTGQNYIRVVHATGRESWYKFNVKTGLTDYISKDDVVLK